jgi:hypothetical protein
MLTIDLNPELEAQLRAESARTGLDTSAIVVRLLEERLLPGARMHHAAALSDEDASLLQEINKGLPEELWQEYHRLVAKRRTEDLTPEEHARLIVISDKIAEAHTQRISSLAELAGRWHISLPDLMQQLGIKPRKV